MISYAENEFVTFFSGVLSIDPSSNSKLRMSGSDSILPFRILLPLFDLLAEKDKKCSLFFFRSQTHMPNSNN